MTERNVVVDGDTFDGHTSEHIRKRSTDRAAFSVGQLLYHGMLGEPISCY